MDRRSILKGIFAAAVAGVALTATQASAAKVFGLDKYATMVQLQQGLIDHWSMRDFYRNNSQPIPQCFREVTQAKVDEILGYSMDNFTGDTTTREAHEECSKIFNNRDYADTMSIDGLKRIMEVIVPIAVARHLLARQRITFDPSKMKNWDRFADKYQDLILSA